MELTHRQTLTSEEDRVPATILELLEAVERSLTASHSRRAYRTALLNFLHWCAAAPNRNLGRLTVLQYKDHLVTETRVSDGETKRRYSPATVNLRLAAIRAFALEASDRGLLSDHEVAGIRRVRGEKGHASRLGTWLGAPEVERILLGPDRGSLCGMRDYALLSILFSTGLRRSEVTGLLVSDIQQREGQWGLLDLVGKGGKVRSVPLPCWVKDAVFVWLKAACVTQGAVFRSISRGGRVSDCALSDESIKLILTRYATKEHFPGFRPHDARRTCARLLRVSNASLEDIKELLGHSSVQTTERYLGKSSGFQRAITDALREPVKM